MNVGRGTSCPARSAAQACAWVALWLHLLTAPLPTSAQDPARRVARASLRWRDRPEDNAEIARDVLRFRTRSPVERIVLGEPPSAPITAENSLQWRPVTPRREVAFPSVTPAGSKPDSADPSAPVEEIGPLPGAHEVATPSPATGPPGSAMPGANSPAGPPANALPGPAPDRPRNPEELMTKLRRRGDLILSETTLRQALLQIGQSWQINIVMGDDVAGDVNGSFLNAPLHEILHAILFAKGYGYRVVGDSLAVMKIDALGDMNPLFESATIHLYAVSPAEIVKAASLFKSPQGKIESIDSARTLLVVDLPERVGQIRQFIQSVDRAAAVGAGNPLNEPQKPRAVHYPLQFIKAKSVDEAIKPLLSKEGAEGRRGIEGKSAVVELENVLIVYDIPSKLAEIAEIIRFMDTPRPQVRITALIYDVDLKDLEKIGIDWSKAQSLQHNPELRGVAATGSSTATTTSTPTSTTTTASGSATVTELAKLGVGAGTGAVPTGAMSLTYLTRSLSMSTIISMLNSAEDARLLADPSVVVLNRETANIQIVTEVPYQQLTQTQQGGNIGTTAFKNAGVELNVTPRIAFDGTIELEVNPSFKLLAGYSQSQQPIIDNREAKTTVRVANQQTLVIAGLRQRSDGAKMNGIPGLKDMKVIGKIFRYRETTARESELIVFITPEIVTPVYQGRPREGSAYAAGTSILEHIPIGQDPYGAPIGPMGPEMPYPAPGEVPAGPGIAPPNGLPPNGMPPRSQPETLPPPPMETTGPPRSPYGPGNYNIAPSNVAPGGPSLAPAGNSVPGNRPGNVAPSDGPSRLGWRPGLDGPRVATRPNVGPPSPTATISRIPSVDREFPSAPPAPAPQPVPPPVPNVVPPQPAPGPSPSTRVASPPSEIRPSARSGLRTASLPEQVPSNRAPIRLDAPMSDVIRR